MSENTTRNHIEKYGFTMICIEATDYLPSFVYTIGLWEKYRHSEIICLGLSIKILQKIISEVVDWVKNGQNIQPNKEYKIFDKKKMTVLRVDKENLNDYFGAGINHYHSEDFPAIQLVWADNKGKYPWETDFNADYKYIQPLLDRNMDFKFFEDKRLGIFTTRQWLENDAPILKVIHDEDGDWIFLTSDEVLQEDVRMVALEQMLIKDKTLNDIFDLDYGEQAERKCIGSYWKRT